MSEDNTIQHLGDTLTHTEKQLKELRSVRALALKHYQDCREWSAVVEACNGLEMDLVRKIGGIQGDIYRATMSKNNEGQSA